MIRIPSFIILMVVCASVFSQGVKMNAKAMEYAESITAEDLKKHLTVLASDAYEGRETCMKGQEMASAYIVKHYESLKLTSFGSTDRYRQRLPIIILDPAKFNISVGGVDLKLAEEYVCSSGMKDGTVKATELLFAGYGIDDSLYSDYEGLNAKGKLLVILDNEPVGKGGRSIITGETDPSDWTYNPEWKRAAAKKAGAIGVIVLRKDMFGKMDRMKKRAKRKRMLLDWGEKNRHHFLSVHLTESKFTELFGESINLKKVAKTIKKTQKTHHQTIKAEINIVAKGNVKECESANMVAMIKGKTKPNEYVFITSHYDHIGIIDGKINNGADDDGSGTVGVLEIAEAFQKAAAAGSGPARSVVFLNFAGEEKGLLGSRYFMNDPPIDPERMVVDLNIDMIGRQDKAHENDPDYVYLIGADRISKELNEVSEAANLAYTKLKLDYKYNDERDPNRYYYRSDHYNFASKGVPVIFYFNGVHADYHKPTDTVEKINFEKMEKITRLVFYTAWEIANREHPLIRDTKPEQ